MACARLDGMPLGIELAAAWSGTMTPQELVTALDDRFRLLIRGPHGVAGRHQTLVASMDWSYDLLEEEDRRLFRWLAVFPGSFTRAAAHRMFPAGVDVLGGLRRLIEKSLLVADLREDVTRYRMLETVRQYARSRLDAADETEEACDRHLDTYLGLAEGVRHLLDEDKDAWRAIIAADYDNFRAAVAWGLTRRDDRGRRLAAELAWFWHFGNRGDEGLDLLRRAVALGADGRTGLQARLLTGLALVADTAERVPSDPEAAEVATIIAEERGDLPTACLARQLTAVNMLGADFDVAWDHAAAAEAAATRIGYGFGRDGALAIMGIVAHLRDRHDDAVPLLRSAIDGLVPRGDRGIAATALGYLAMSAAHTGDLSGARDLAIDGVRVATPLGDVHRVGFIRTVLAYVTALAGRPDEAWSALEPVLRLVEDVPSPPFVPGLTERLGLLHLLSGKPDLALACYERDLGKAPGMAPAESLTPRALVGLATALHRTGDHTAAGRRAAEALRFGRDLGMAGLTAEAQAVLAELAEPTDRHRAEKLHHEALALRTRHGLRPACVDSLEAIARLTAEAGSTVQASRIAGACARAREELAYPGRLAHDLPVHADAYTEGRRMDLDDVIGYAMRSRGARSRPASGWASLTPTERNVVALAVEGLSNPEIGARLFMSRATVKTHLSHVYAKLQVANRTELATTARLHRA